MAQKQGPLFLERGSYRRRRMMDAVRLVVVLGAGLWMIPALWPVPEAGEVAPVAMSDALYYVFGVWLFLIVVSVVLSTRLSDPFANAGEAERDT